MKNRNLHDEVRVVYRACRRIYGKEKTQDECLRIFKIVFPELYRLKASENERETLAENIRFDIQRITKSWHPTDRLKQLADKVDSLIGLPLDYERTELIKMLEDITPVAMRIRKLTPRECFRLMGVSEKDIDTIQSSGISKSAQYKLAGNSIVAGGNNTDSQGNVDGVLYNIFRKMFVDTDMENNSGKPIQLTFDF